MLSKADKKFVGKLHQKKFRLEENQFVVEGKKLVLEAAKSEACFSKIFAKKDWLSAYSELIKKLNDEQVVEVSQKELEQISQMKSPDSVLAIVDIPSKEKKIKFNKLTICLDRISDPGNLGTILRIADWFGVDQIICSNDTVDVYNNKVVQASMGAIFRIPVFYEDLAVFFEQYASKIPLYIADLDGNDIFKTKFDAPMMLLIGKESEGVDENLKKYTRHKITIQGKGQAESLNAAVSCGIVCAAVMNQMM